jgi:hypothetical protein
MAALDPLVLERRLSHERIASYRSAAGGDLVAAIALYEWNSRISGALLETINHVEVVVRNAMHEQLTAWSLATFNEPLWYLDPGRILNRRTVEDVDVARRRAAIGHGVTPGRVVAELNLGFWRYLTAHAYDRSLWRTCRYRAFPRQSRVSVHDALRTLNLARNRCAHNEPMHNRPIADLHATALEVVGWICPKTRTWISTRSRVPRNLLLRP